MHRLICKLGQKCKIEKKLGLGGRHIIGIRAISVRCNFAGMTFKVGRFSPFDPIVADLTNVGVDDFDAVNSSTLCVFGVEPPSDATVPGPRVL